MGQVILVTGSSSGFGRLTAETLARQGHRVFASMRNTRSKNAQAKGEIEALARQAKLALEVVELNVIEDRSVDQAVAAILGSAGRIDVVVNNAGIGCFGVNESFTPDQVKLLFETNFFGADRVNRAVLPSMRRQRSGLLVHVSSVAGRVVIPFLGPYCATKFALEALAESYRYDLADFGIDSVLVEPGVFNTDIGANGLRPADAQRTAQYEAVQDKVLSVGRAFPAYLAKPEAPQPQEVADAIAGLIAKPPGERPLRMLVGPDARHLERLNQVAVQAQGDTLRSIGIAVGP